MSIYKKLNKARTEFHQLKLSKTGHNKFAGYYYFELGDFLIPALKVFADNGLCAIVSFDALTACMRIVDDDTQETVTITSPMGSAALKGCHEVQNIGAVETYQRRYLWVAALEIVEHDALDAVTGSKQGEPKQGQPLSGVWESMPSDIQLDLLEAAKECHKIFNDGKGEPAVVDANIAKVVDYLNKQGFDSDLKSALWTQLNSKIRAAIKKETESRKLAA